MLGCAGLGVLGRACRAGTLTSARHAPLLAANVPLSPTPPPSPQPALPAFCCCSQQYPLVEERLKDVAGRVAPVNSSTQALGDLCEYIRQDSVSACASVLAVSSD